jgi:hypothetical protein
LINFNLSDKLKAASILFGQVVVGCKLNFLNKLLRIV